MFELLNVVKRSKFYFFATLLLFSVTANLSANEEQVAKLLESKVAPIGVVFEVVSWDEAYLKTAFDAFENHQKRLKAKFPEIKLAIVTHGNEQFSLTESNKEKYQDTHQQVQRITETDVPVHICAGHARMRAIDVKAFPDYVSVSQSGPAEIATYQAQEYILVIL